MNPNGTHDRASLSALAQAIEDNIRDENRGDTVHRLLMLSFGRVQFNYHRKLNRSLTTRETRDMMEFNRHLPHIADWLEAAVLNDEPWLKRVDDQNRPKKLMKFGTLQQIVNEADKAMIKASQKGRGFTLDENHEKGIAKLTDGFFLIEMLTAQALDRESSFMQHCIGNGAYDKKLGDGNHRYLSLRDRNGRPHVTIELKRLSLDGSIYSPDATADGYYWRIEQYYGKQNKSPIAEYGEILGPYLENSRFGIKLGNVQVPYIVDRNLTWHHIDALPEAMDVVNFQYIGDESSALIHNIQMPSKLYNVESVGLSKLKMDRIYDWETENVKKIHLRHCQVGIFDNSALTGKNLEVHFGEVTGGDLPGIIECGTLFIRNSNFTKWPQRIRTNSSVGISPLNSESPIDITAKTAAISVSLNNNVKHKIKVQTFCFMWNNESECLPYGIDTEELQIHWEIPPKHFFIPDGTKVSIKLVIEDLNDFEDLQIPSSIPDRVLLVNYRNREQMHVGEWRNIQLQNTSVGCNFPR